MTVDLEQLMSMEFSVDLDELEQHDQHCSCRKTAQGAEAKHNIDRLYQFPAFLRIGKIFESRTPSPKAGLTLSLLIRTKAPSPSKV
eukprot:6430543-Amphidinium_carterae.1